MRQRLQVHAYVVQNQQDWTDNKQLLITPSPPMTLSRPVIRPIISSCNSPFELLIRESLLIGKFNPALKENIRFVPPAFN